MAYNSYIHKVTAFIAGVLLTLVALQAVNSRGPTIQSPWPIVIIILAWLSLPKLFIFSLPPLVMWAWNPTAFTGNTAIPRRSWWLYFGISLLSICYIAIYATIGAKYQGTTFMSAIVVINALLMLTLLTLGIRLKNKHSYPLSLLFHWILFAWAFSYAFPVLGELP